MLEIKNTDADDLAEVFRLFDLSVVYQEEHGYNSWRGYDKSALIRDNKHKNQYKILQDGAIAIVFSACYTDKILWRERDNGSSVYLHRIAVNPAFKGKKLFGIILPWAINHAREKHLDTIRMDTWADNPTIIAYYKSFGFEFIENFTTSNSEDLPVHNRNLVLALLEYKVGQ